MSRFGKFLSAAVLAASLAPFAAHARPADVNTAAPAQHLVRVSNAQSQHGRLAENSKVPATFVIAPTASAFANSTPHNCVSG